MNTTAATTTSPTATTLSSARRRGRSGAAVFLLLATILAVLLPAGSASAREAASKSKDGCVISVSKPTAISTWQRQVKTTIRCSSARGYHYGSNSVMNDVPNRADRVVASRSLTAGTLRAGVTYTWTSTWNTGSTNGYGQYARAVIKLNNWSAAVVVESGTVDGVFY